MNKLLDVVIVGAGPTGLALAAALTQAGVSYRIFDRSEGPQSPSHHNDFIIARGGKIEFGREFIHSTEQADGLTLSVRSTRNPNTTDIIHARHLVRCDDIGAAPMLDSGLQGGRLFLAENVHDARNLGWKLVAVHKLGCSHQILDSYSVERDTPRRLFTAPLRFRRKALVIAGSWASEFLKGPKPGEVIPNLAVDKQRQLYDFLSVEAHLLLVLSPMAEMARAHAALLADLREVFPHDPAPAWRTLLVSAVEEHPQLGIYKNAEMLRAFAINQPTLFIVRPDARLSLRAPLEKARIALLKFKQKYFTTDV